MTALIILAAGSSSRLGKPKQNLLFKDKTLLQQAIETALGSKCAPIIVVLGANTQLVSPDVPQENITIVYNDDWNEGIASSIRSGVSEIENNKAINNALIMLCDQPFVNSLLLNDLITKQQETSKSIIACTYGDTVGVPALFNRSLFPELLSLKGDEGAKKIIKDHLEDIAKIPFDMGSIDIDTIEDYEQLLKKAHN
jgi:molybdenum cofactor cytidylyltransferase